MIKIYNFLLNPLYDNRFYKTFIILFLLNFICVCYSQYFVLNGIYNGYFFAVLLYRVAMFLVTYGALLFLVYQLRINILQNLVLIVLLGLTFVYFIVDMFLLYNFKFSLNTYFIAITMETNIRESVEFLETYVDSVLIVVYIVSIAICFLLYRYIKPLANFAWVKWVFLVLLLILVVIHITRNRPSSPELRYSDMVYHSSLIMKDFYTNTKKYIKQYKKFNEKFDELTSEYEAIKPTDPVSNITLIIGESAQRGHFSLYGYERYTNPLLSELKRQFPDNIFIFNDVISSKTSTSQALSQALTFANQENKNLWYEQLNLIDAMKLGGYKTIAISNQENMSIWSSVAVTILKRASYVDFLNYTDSFGLVRFDEGILPALDKYLTSIQNSDEYRFYVLHLMGSHSVYSKRYPIKFTKFGQNMGSLFYNKQKFAINTYDNSILYSDYIISQIIYRFKGGDSIVIYFSDHGEEVYEVDNFIGHGRTSSRFVVEIPFIIYVSDEFKQKHKMLYERIKQAKNQRYMNDDLIHTILDIAGVNIKGYEPKRSIFTQDASLLDSRKRIVGDDDNLKDYDIELKHQKRAKLYDEILRE